MVDKRTQLLEAAIELFAREGFWNTPTARIAKHANVATGTLFNYFASKDALIDAVYLQLKGEWGSNIQDNYPTDGDIKACLEHVWFQYFDWAARNPTRYQLMHQLALSNLVSHDAAQKHLADFDFLYSGLKERGASEGVFGHYSLDYVNAILVAQLDASVDYAIAQKMHGVSLAKFIMQSFELFWNGVTA